MSSVIEHLHHAVAATNNAQMMILAFVIFGSVLWGMVLFGWIHQHWPRYGYHTGIFRGSTLNARNHEMITRVDLNE